MIMRIVFFHVRSSYPLQWPNVLVLDDHHWQGIEFPDKKFCIGCYSSQPRTRYLDSMWWRRQGKGWDGSGPRPVQQVAGGVLAGQKKVMLSGQHRDDRRGQHQVPDHTGVGVRCLVGGHFMQGAIGSVGQVVVNENIQKHRIHCQLTEVKLLPVVNEGEGRQAWTRPGWGRRGREGHSHGSSRGRWLRSWSRRWWSCSILVCSRSQVAAPWWSSSLLLGRLYNCRSILSFPLVGHQTRFGWNASTYRWLFGKITFLLLLLSS